MPVLPLETELSPLPRIRPATYGWETSRRRTLRVEASNRAFRIPGADHLCQRLTPNILAKRYLGMPCFMQENSKDHPTSTQKAEAARLRHSGSYEGHIIDISVAVVVRSVRPCSKMS